MRVTKALCGHQLVLQELGGVRDWKSVLLFTGTRGVTLELFLFLIICLVNQGGLIPACHCTELFNSPFTSIYVQVSRVPSVPVGPQCERLKWKHFKHFPESNVECYSPSYPISPQICAEAWGGAMNVLFSYLFLKKLTLQKNNTKGYKEKNASFPDL